MSYAENLRINSPLSDFGELRTVERTPLIELKSAVDTVSSFRNIVTTAGGATATISNSEYHLQTTAAASDRVVLDSAERGRYMPGYEAIVGIGVREDVSNPALTGDMEERWGYYDDNDGYFFGRDATGLYIGIRRAGSDTKVYQSNWNGDKLNGSGPSGLTLDLHDGNIFQIRYSWYGYGVINFEVLTKDVTKTPVQYPTIVHTIDPRTETSVEQPNLPIRVEVLNGTTATGHTLHVSGRQYTISGKYTPHYRLTSDFRGSVSTSTTWVPLISFRRKSSSKFLAQSVKMAQMETIASTDNHVVGFVLNGTLTGASWQTPTSQNVNETVLESDVSATAISGGIFIGGFHSVQASNKNNPLSHETGFNFDFIESQPVTMVARTLTGTDSIAMSLFSVSEEW